MTVEPERRLDRYVRSVIVAGAAAVTISVVGYRWPQWTSQELAITLLLIGGLVAGELLPARLWRGDSFREYTFSGTFTIALIITGPLWLALLVQLGALFLEEMRERRAPLKAAFNLGQYALSIVCARAVYAAMSGQPFADFTPRLTPEFIVPSLVASAAYFLVNVLLVSAVLSLASDEPLLRSTVGHVRDELSMTTTLLCVAPIVVLSLQFSLLTAPLCLLPIIAVRQGARSAAASDVQALHDSLTELPNRTLLLERARRAAGLTRGGEHTGLLMLDLDHFKEINDTLGHHVGDQLLRLVAERLSSVARKGDTVARFGGDEFAVLCPALPGVSVAEGLSQRFVDALAEPFPLEEITLHVEASVGIALLPLHAGTIEQLLQRADVALYQAKAERGTTRTYDKHADFNSVERLGLMEQFRAGLDSELVLHYQPKCRTSDGEVVGVEALVRWQHPQRGLLPPSEFIPAAENSGLIVPMTIRILTKSLEQVRSWRAEGLHLNVAVNVSPRHLADINLPTHVQTLLESFGLPGSVLTLEVTESSIMSDPARAAQVLRQLRDLDVAVSIDDFGTGYSSLAYLRDLSATEVKIDRTFVHNAQANPRDLAIVKAAVELGHTLGLLVVAEGIEDAATAALMASSGCDYLQGYHILPPSPATEITLWCDRPQVWTRSLPGRLADHRLAAER